MKKIIVLSSLSLVAGLVSAQELGRVISATPMTQQVSTPQTVCQGYQGANVNGAIIGAIAGGLVGNAITHHSGATAIGALGGAAIGSQAGYRDNCYTQSSYQNRVTGYNVVYEYRGETYSTQTSTRPGRYIEVDSSLTYNTPSYNEPITFYSEPQYAPAPVVVYRSPAPVVVYRDPYYTPYYAPVYHGRGWYNEGREWHGDQWNRHR